MYKKQSYCGRAKKSRTTTRKRSNIILKTFETSDLSLYARALNDF